MGPQVTDTMPGTRPNPEPLVLEAPPEPSGGQDSGGAGLPPAPPKPDNKPSRPTTRAGRRAAAEARKAAGQAKPEKAPKAKSVPRKASLETRITGSLVSLGTMVAAAGSMTSPAVQLDGVALIQNAPSIGAALDKVAKDDPRVAAALERMLTAGVWSGLVAAMLPLVLAIAANHGAIPKQIADMLGVAAPDLAAEAPAGSAPGPAAGSVPVV
jgi:hypothetical protein